VCGSLPERERSRDAKEQILARHREDQGGGPPSQSLLEASFLRTMMSIYSSSSIFLRASQNINSYHAIFVYTPPIWGVLSARAFLRANGQPKCDYCSSTFLHMARLLPAGFPESLLHLRGLGCGAAALLAVVALSPAGALAIPIGPLKKSNNEAAPKASYQESRIGVSEKCKPLSLNQSSHNTEFNNSILSERPSLTPPVQ